MRYELLTLNPRSRKVCMGIHQAYCTKLITEIDRFSVDVHFEGSDYDDAPLITYPFFEVNDKGQGCIVLDENFIQLCPGRYVFRVMLGCKLVDTIRFIFGGTPTIGDVDVEESEFNTCGDSVESVIPPNDCLSCENWR